MTGQDSLKTRRTLNVNGKAYDYFSVEAAGEALGVDFTRLPYSMKVLLENLLRSEDGGAVKVDDIKAIGQWLTDKTSTREIRIARPRADAGFHRRSRRGRSGRHARRDGKLGGDPKQINPLSPVDLVIDHSVHDRRVRHAGRPSKERRSGVRAQSRAL